MDSGIKTLFWGLILLLVIVNLVSAVVSDIRKHQDMYGDCLDACVEKPLTWNQDAEVINFNYDRVDCIGDCNNFYLNLID